MFGRLEVATRYWHRWDGGFSCDGTEEAEAKRTFLGLSLLEVILLDCSK